MEISGIENSRSKFLVELSSPCVSEVEVSARIFLSFSSLLLKVPEQLVKLVWAF